MAVAKMTGAVPVWFVENDPAASAVLHHRYPDVPNVGDLTTLDFYRMPFVNVLTAGYPCQPFSHAGLRKGSDDHRHLWPYIEEAVHILRPPLCIFENVQGHLTKGGGTVVRSLTSMGYSVRWGLVRASDAGAPHRRARVFIVASHPDREHGYGSRDTGKTGGVNLQTAIAENTNSKLGDELGQPAPGEAQSGRARADVGGPDRVGTVNLLPTPTARDHKGRNQRDDDSCLPGALLPTHGNSLSIEVQTFGKYAPAVARWEDTLGVPAPSPTMPGRNDKPRLNPAFAEWMMGIPGWITDVPGISRTQALKMIGNAVCPQQALLALELIWGEGSTLGNKQPMMAVDYDTGEPL